MIQGRVYTLIKEYPGSPKLGAIVIGGDIGTTPYSAYRGEFLYNTIFAKPVIENSPEYWQSISIKDDTSTDSST